MSPRFQASRGGLVLDISARQPSARPTITARAPSPTRLCPTAGGLEFGLGLIHTVSVLRFLARRIPPVPDLLLKAGALCERHANTIGQLQFDKPREGCRPPAEVEP